MSHELSFAQALNEAKQVIIQQSNRIKADLEKIKSQQQTIVDQCATITEQERKLREQGESLAGKTEECTSLDARLQEETAARVQAEAVVDRQGERITTMQTAVADMERRVAEHSEKVEKLTRMCDELTAQIPSKEDEDALAAMLALLSKKSSSASNNGNLRITNEHAQAA